MRKTVRKFMALTMVGVLMITPLTTFAADTTEETTEESAANGSAEGDATLEGYLGEDDKIFKVVLPTEDAASAAFAFTMDPQNLLYKTQGDGTDYTDGQTVIFTNGDTPTYSDTSDTLTVTNKSMFDVDLKLTATMSGLADETAGYDIKMTSDNTFANDTTTSLYLAMVHETTTANSVVAVAETTTPITADASGVSVTATIGGTPDNYEPKKGADGYTYAEIASPNDYDGTATFKLTGKCNPNGDWSKLDDASSAAPKVTVAWELKKHTPAPSIQTSATFTKGTALSLPVTLGSGDTAATKATVTVASSTTGTFAAATGVSYNATSKSIDIAGTALSGAAADSKRYLKVVFNDTAKTTIIVELTIAVATE